MTLSVGNHTRELEVSTLRTSSLPGHLTHCKAFPLRGRDVVLLYDTTSKGPSVQYDLLQQQVRGERSLRFGASPQQDIAFVQKRYLLAIGLGRIQCYDTHANRMVKLAKPTIAIRTQGSATIATPDGGIYVAGGKDRSNHYIKADMEYYYWGSPRWNSLPPMQFARRDAVGVYIAQLGTNSHQVVMVGGHYWHRQTTRYTECPYTEVYNGHGWVPGPSLNVARRNHCAVLINENVIVVLGGTNNGREVDTVEAWHLDTQDFVVIGHLRNPRTNFSAIVVGNDVFIFGGGSHLIEKLHFEPDDLSLSTLQALAPETSLPTAPPSTDEVLFPAITATAPPSEMDSTVPVLGNGDRKPAAVEKPTETPTSRKCLSLPHTTLRLPDPPTRPRMPLCSTLHERNNALEQYIERLEQLNQQYKRRVEETGSQIVDAYEKACQKEMETLEQETKVWKDDTDRLVEQARQELECQSTFLAREAGFLSKALQEADDDHYEDDVPSQLRCPITLNIMTDPVVAADGNTYERSALESWFATQSSGKPLSPLTGAVLPSKAFFPVHTLKSLCQQFAKDQTSAAVVWA